MTDSKPTETGTFREQMNDHIVRLVALHALWDRLIVRTRWLIAGAAVSAVAMLVVGVGMAIHAVSISAKVNAVAAQLDESTRLLENLRDESATKSQVEDVKQQVEAVVEDQPRVEIRQDDAGAGRPRAVVVVRPKAPKPPPAPPPAGSPAPPPAVEIPVALPPGTRVEDGGVRSP